MSDVTVHERRQVFDGFFKIEEAVVSYRGADGATIGPVRRLSLERGDSVAALVFHRERRCVILAEQFRYPTYEKGPGWLTELLAGMVDPGETPEQSARREVLEESGYEVERLQHVSTFYLSPGGSSERIILYYAEVTDANRVSPGGGHRGDGEDIRVVEVPIERLQGELAAGRIADAKTLTGILWFLATRPERSGR
jgi:ADP-ribose pyrophosphatase